MVRFGRTIVAALIELVLLAGPLAPLVASGNDFCEEMPCCRGAHASCKRSAHSGAGWNAVPECLKNCGQGPGLTATPLSLPGDAAAGSPQIAVSHLSLRPVTIGRDRLDYAVLYQRPPPQFSL